MPGTGHACKTNEVHGLGHLARLVLASAAMKSRWLTLLVVLYVTLDFANPLMPGAVNFDPDGSVEGLPAQDRHPCLEFVGVPTPVPPSTESREVPCVTARRPQEPDLCEWLVDVRQARSNPSEPPSLSEDH
jgi:hypothetical protein